MVDRLKHLHANIFAEHNMYHDTSTTTTTTKTEDLLKLQGSVHTEIRPYVNIL